MTSERYTATRGHDDVPDDRIQLLIELPPSLGLTDFHALPAEGCLNTLLPPRLLDRLVETRTGDRDIPKIMILLRLF